VSALKVGERKEESFFLNYQWSGVVYDDDSLLSPKTFFSTCEREIFSRFLLYIKIPAEISHTHNATLLYTLYISRYEVRESNSTLHSHTDRSFHFSPGTFKLQLHFKLWEKRGFVLEWQKSIKDKNTVTHHIYINWRW